jgi:hypothetical protein
MTNRTPTLTPHRPTPDSPNATPASPTSQAGDLHSQSGPTRGIGLAAGVALLVLAALSAAGVLVAVDGLVTPGDAAKTAEDITGSATRFRLGVASLYLVVVLDVFAAWALFRFFAPVDVWLSRLAAWLRVAYSVVFLVALSQLATIPGLLSDPRHQAAFGEQQLQAQAMLKVEAFDHTWMAALLLFGAHLALLGYLAYRSGYVPRLVGVVLLIAGAGYAFDTLSSVLFADPVVISTVTSLGELVLAIWLVARSRRISRPNNRQSLHL